jgi:hypothetical protein
MAIAWPVDVVGNLQTETAIALGANQTSPLTGTTQGGGSSVVMWRLELAFPPQNALAKVRKIRRIFARAKQDTVAIPVLQPGLVIGTPGNVTVAAGHVAGSKTIPLQNIGAGFAFQEGQFISIQRAGKWYLYNLAADSAAGAASRSVTIDSTSRAAHAAGDAVEIVTPYIEGWIEPSSLTVDVAHHYGFSIAIAEAQ